MRRRADSASVENEPPPVLSRRTLLERAGVAAAAAGGTAGCLERRPRCRSGSYVGKRRLTQWYLRAPAVERRAVERFATALTERGYYTGTFDETDFGRARPWRSLGEEGTAGVWLVIVGSLDRAGLISDARAHGVSVDRLERVDGAGNPLVTERRQLDWPWKPTVVEARVELLRRVADATGLSLSPIDADGQFLTVESTTPGAVDRVSSLLRPVGVLVARWDGNEFVSFGPPEGNRLVPSTIAVDSAEGGETVRIESRANGRGWPKLFGISDGSSTDVLDRPIRFFLDGREIGSRPLTDLERRYAGSFRGAAVSVPDTRPVTVRLPSLPQTAACRAAVSISHPSAIPLTFESQC